MKTILENYVIRPIRLGCHKISPRYKKASSSYIDSNLGVVRTVSRSEEMRGFTLDMFKLGAMLDAGVRIDPSPALFSQDRLAIASKCERVASSISGSIDLLNFSVSKDSDNNVDNSKN